MSLKSVCLTGRLEKAPEFLNSKFPVANIYLVIPGGKKYGDIKFRVDCFGPIANKVNKDLSEGDKITVEGTIRKPIVMNGEPMNYVNANKIHYVWTKKYNEVYKPQMELKLGKLV